MLLAVVGFVLGPMVHHVAVTAGADLPFKPLWQAYGPLFGGGARRAPTRAWITSAAHGILWGLFTWATGFVWVLGAHLFLASMTLALFITDLDHKRIPNRITYPGTPFAALLLGLGAIGDGAIGAFPRALWGALVYSGVLFVVYLAARGGFGFGDVKLAIPLGLFLGFEGWGSLYAGGLITALLGALIALVVVAVGRGNAKAEIPYGPPMILGAWVALIGGTAVTDLVL